MKDAKLVRISKKGQFVIPKDVREALGLEEGQALLVTVEGQRIILTQPGQYASGTRGILKGAWGSKKSSIDRYLNDERDSWD